MVEEKPCTSTLSKLTPPSAGGNYQMFICQKTCFITSHLPLPSQLAPSNTVRMKSNVMVETKQGEADEHKWHGDAHFHAFIFG